jgi:mono/diheme cytochrome c family protein
VDSYRRSATPKSTTGGAATRPTSDTDPTVRDPSADYADGTDDADEEDRPRRGRGCGCWIALLVVILLGAGGGAFVGGTLILREKSPAPLEPELTDLGLRYVAIPAEFADMRRPTGPNISAQKGQAIFGAQCAICHGINGDGKGDFGPLMYPQAANLHEQRTRSKSDGQLFYIIAHGINLTGMPGFGKKYASPGVDPNGLNSDDDIWSLVQYIREQFHGEKPPAQ